MEPNTLWQNVWESARNQADQPPAPPAGQNGQMPAPPDGQNGQMPMPADPPAPAGMEEMPGCPDGMAEQAESARQQSGYGDLPASAPLANPYVPYQRDDPERYEQARALIRGTLFPGLDLPLFSQQNFDEKEGPLARLMALSFAVTELGEYLDTHSYDTQVLNLFRKYTGEYKTALEKYEQTNGPLLQAHSGGNGVYDWTRSPWPWDYVQEV